MPKRIVIDVLRRVRVPYLFSEGQADSWGDENTEFINADGAIIDHSALIVTPNGNWDFESILTDHTEVELPAGDSFETIASGIDDEISSKVEDIPVNGRIRVCELDDDGTIHIRRLKRRNQGRSLTDIPVSRPTRSAPSGQERRVLRRGQGNGQGGSQGNSQGQGSD